MTTAGGRVSACHTAPLMRSAAPPAQSTCRVHPTRVCLTRYVPPPGFPTLLTAYSLRASRPRGPVPLMRFTLQSLSPPRSRTPFDASALLPFLAWRVPALRTRKSPCPAAPGPYSPRRSVLRRAEAHQSRCSHGLFCLSRAFPDCRGSGFPDPSFLRFSHPPSGRSGVRRSKALPRDRVGRLLAEPSGSLEVFTRDLTSASPDDRGVPSVETDRK